METLQIIWFILIGVLLLGYSILDGFDLGVGVLTPFLAKGEEDKKLLFRSVGPFWDGNEVWILTGGGALFAAFPHAYATVFSGFYLALMVVLFSLIFRAVSLDFWAHSSGGMKNFWEKAFIVGSALPALLYGVALGNVVVGVPLNGSMEFTGNFFTLLRPFPLAVGLLGFTAFLLQGLTYVNLKLEGDIQERAKQILPKIWIAFIVLFGLTAILAIVCGLGYGFANILAWIFAIIAIVAWFMIKKYVDSGTECKAFIMSSTMFAGLWGIIGSVHFPNVVKAIDPKLSLTIYNASSSQLTLTVMLIIALIGMPFVIGYTIWVYHYAFKGKIKAEDTFY